MPIRKYDTRVLKYKSVITRYVLSARKRQTMKPGKRHISFEHSLLLHAQSQVKQSWETDYIKRITRRKYGTFYVGKFPDISGGNEYVNNGFRHT